MIDDTMAMLAFNLKLVGQKSRKNVLISAGKLSDKQKLLPAIRELSQLNLRLYATQGTSDFLSQHGVNNQELYKITSDQEPNIRSFLQQDRFDLVINILVGNHDYDEASDSNLIRSQCIEHGIPLITDPDVALLTIRDLLRKHRDQVYQYKIADPERPWDMRREFLQLVADRGGFANYHNHFDKAYLISRQNLQLSQMDMQKKWQLYRFLKENYTFDDLVERMSRAVETMLAQGVTHCRTHIDADDTVGLLPMEAALAVRKRYQDRITLEFAVQPLQGVLDPAARDYFTQACQMADIIGALPSRDRPQPERHLDFVMSLAKSLGKPIDAHVDQENNPDEHETELLALKTIEHGLQGQVSAVHAISLASQPLHEQQRVARLLRQAAIDVISCPSAALSMKMLDRNAPLHNSIAPLAVLLQEDVPVRVGVDNINDLFMPLVDGDMWFECRLLMEANRFYDLEKVADLVCDKRGFQRHQTHSKGNAA